MKTNLCSVVMSAQGYLKNQPIKSLSLCSSDTISAGHRNKPRHIKSVLVLLDYSKTNVALNNMCRTGNDGSPSPTELT